jgi:hypothetical protein
MHSGWIIAFILVALAAVVAFAYALMWRIGVVALGEKEVRWDRPGLRIGNFLLNVFGQRRLLSEPYGIVHFFIFWGFVFICLGEIPLFFEGLFGIKVPFLGTNPYFLMIKDIIAAVVILCLLIAAYRRWVLKPPRLYRTAEAAIILILIFCVIVSEWLTSGARVALEPTEATALAPVYNAVAALLRGSSESTLVGIRDVFWWVHMLILLGFLVYIPQFQTHAPAGGSLQRLFCFFATARGPNQADESGRRKRNRVWRGQNRAVYLEATAG